MNILVITNMYPSSGDESWRGVFVKEQIDSLYELFPDIHFDILHIRGSISKGGSNFNYLRGLWRYIVMLNRTSYDIVWVHHSFCVFLAAVYKKTPLVYTVHEGVLTKGIKFSIVKYAVKFSDHALYVNKVLFDFSGHANKRFLPSGVDIEKFRCLEYDACRVQLGLNPDKYYVFFPASPRRPEKNSVFVYSFIEKYSSWMASENVEFLFGGGIEYELMPVWMNAVDCMVSFSSFESDGMVFKEAMACNLPVITFDVGNAAIYFKSELTGSIIEPNHKQLRDQISYWKVVGRSMGRDYLLTLGMDKCSVAYRLKKIFEEIIDGKN